MCPNGVYLDLWHYMFLYPGLYGHSSIASVIMSYKLHGNIHLAVCVAV